MDLHLTAMVLKVIAAAVFVGALLLMGRGESVAATMVAVSALAFWVEQRR